MKHKLTYTDNYILVVDDSEIKEGEWGYRDTGVMFRMTTELLDYYSSISQSSKHKQYKIIAHLPLKNSPILEGVPLLPPLEQEDDVEKIAREEILYNDAKREWWKQGYNKAKEKYKYTEEDIERVIRMTRGSDIPMETIIQSLSQLKMPTHFECEEKVSSDSMYVNHVIYESKTTINSQGKTVWVGNYIQEP